MAINGPEANIEVKKLSFWAGIILIILLNLAIMMTAGQADADPQFGDYTIYLPLINGRPMPPDPPDIPPELMLVPLANGFGGDTITGIRHAGDDRLFVVERTGRIHIVQPDGSIVDEPFLDISGKVRTENWEEGLLGLAFHPSYPANPTFFITYTPKPDRMIAISRFSVVPKNPNRADDDSEEVLMLIDKQGQMKYADYRVHNAGDLHFGPDGYLYIAIGDGGPDPWDPSHSGDRDERGQNKQNLLSSILRIDVDVDGGGVEPDCGGSGYEIPIDNPFVDGFRGESCDELWAYGLRNPYRFSFDRASGDLLIADVGEKLREEIHYQPVGSKGGENYGWACYEGSVPYRLDDASYCLPGMEFAQPIFEYDHSNNDCSVIGGYVYRGETYPELAGRYVFGDFCTGRMWLLNHDEENGWSRSIADNTGHFISTFGEDVNGEIYLGEREVGNPGIYRVVVAP